MKKVIFFIIAASFLGAQIFIIDFEFFKISLFRVAIIFSILYILFKTIRFNKYKFMLIPKGKNRYSLQFFIFWLCYGLFSLFWIKDFNLWVKAIYFLGSGVFCAILFINYLKTVEDIIKAFNIIEFMILFHSLIGWYEVVTLNYYFIDKSLLDPYDTLSIGMPVSMLGNPNNFATLMLFGIFISLACLFCNKNKIMKGINIVISISCLFLLFFSRSRANILGLIMAIFVCIALLIKKKKLIFYIGILFGVLIVFLLKFKGLEHLLVGNFEILQFTFSSGLNSEVIRVNLLKNGIQFLIQTFGVGTGAGNIEYWMNNFSIFPVKGVTNIHNWWAEILVGYGVLVFIGYIIFYFKLLYINCVIFNNKKDKNTRVLALAFLSCMVGFLIGSISASSNITVEWLWVFWAVAISFQGISTYGSEK